MFDLSSVFNSMRPALVQVFLGNRAGASASLGQGPLYHDGQQGCQAMQVQQYHFMGGVRQWGMSHRRRDLMRQHRHLSAEQGTLKEQQRLTTEQKDLQRRQELQNLIAKERSTHHHWSHARDMANRRIASYQQELNALDTKLKLGKDYFPGVSDKDYPAAANARAADMLARDADSLNSINARLGLTGLTPAQVNDRVSGMLADVNSSLGTVNASLDSINDRLSAFGGPIDLSSGAGWMQMLGNLLGRLFG